MDIKQIIDDVTSEANRDKYPLLNAISFKMVKGKWMCTMVVPAMVPQRVKGMEELRARIMREIFRRHARGLGKKKLSSA